MWAVIRLGRIKRPRGQFISLFKASKCPQDRGGPEKETPVRIFIDKAAYSD